MKKLQLCLMLFLLWGGFNSINAQIIDLTTGSSGSPGANDPFWSVTQLPSPTFNPALISNGMTGGSFVFLQDPCGQWISPLITGANEISIAATAGTYTYRRSFPVGFCVNSAMLNFSFMAADNSISGIRVNTTPYTVPTGTGFLTSTIFNANVLTAITPGVTNFIEIDVFNAGIYTGLQLCGDLTLTTEEKEYPVDLGCCYTNIGEVLSWSSLASLGVTGYLLDITDNDPNCCNSGSAPITTTIPVTGNTYAMTSSSGCYSWAVRAIYSASCTSAQSKIKCSCAPLDCNPPEDLNCEYDFKFQKNRLNWSVVPGAISYNIEIHYNDPACCKDGAPDYLQMITATTNTILINSNTCFSWRVSAVCAGNTISNWSRSQCGCLESGGPHFMKEKTNQKNNPSINVSLSPNPTPDIIAFDIKASNITQEYGNLKIVDINGEELYHSTIKLEGITKINLDKLKNGVYFYTITADKTQKSGKITISK